MYYQMMAKIRW